MLSVVSNSSGGWIDNNMKEHFKKELSGFELQRSQKGLEAIKYTFVAAAGLGIHCLGFKGARDDFGEDDSGEISYKNLAMYVVGAGIMLCGTYKLGDALGDMFIAHLDCESCKVCISH